VEQVSEEYKITTGTISGAILKSMNAEPSIIVDGKSYTASEFNKAVEMLKQPQLNENQQMLSGAELIGVIYSQLLEDFGFGYIEKDLWMIAENLSEKIANEQPQLNENQQIVLEWLKEQYAESNLFPIEITWLLFESVDNGYFEPEEERAFENLNKSQEAQVLQAFSQWGSEQEEE